MKLLPAKQLNMLTYIYRSRVTRVDSEVSFCVIMTYLPTFLPAICLRRPAAAIYS